MILLDWGGVDLTPKSTPYAKKLVELQDSNAAPDQIYTINSKSWHYFHRALFRNMSRLFLNTETTKYVESVLHGSRLLR